LIDNKKRKKWQEHRQGVRKIQFEKEEMGEKTWKNKRALKGASAGHRFSAKPK
jgi:hypothetical protein